MVNKTVVVVEWFDASYQRGECYLPDLIPRVVLRTAGFLIREDEESISIALDEYPEGGTFRHVEHIPKVNITKIRRLKL